MKKTMRSWNSTIPRESAKRKRLNRERSKAVAEKKRANPFCEFPGRPGIEEPCRKLMDDVHERLARSGGGSIIKQENLVSLCRGHHDWITFDVEGMKWALANDFVISRHDVRAKALKK